MTELQVKIFFAALKTAGLPKPEREYVFAPPRKWRFDFAWPHRSLALEVDGGVWVKGRHTRGSGWLKDTEKLNTAATLGWRLLRSTPQHVATPAMMATIQEALEWRDLRP